MVSFRKWLGKILIWQKFSGKWKSDFQAFGTKMQFFKLLSVNNSILSSSESLFSDILSFASNILTDSFQCGHFPAQFILESQMIHLEIFPFLLSGFNLLTFECFVEFLLDQLLNLTSGMMLRMVLWKFFLKPITFHS